VVTVKEKSHVNLIEERDGKTKTVEHEVTVGPRNDRDVQIKSGLKTGEKVQINPPAPSEVKF
jgi:multidrug efflux pump subunit AcrA (membrane-fusion protein)